MPASSPFTPVEDRMILAGAAIAALAAAWIVLGTLSRRRRLSGAVRYGPVGLAILMLSAAVFGAVVVLAVPFFVHHPLRVLMVPFTGMVACFLAYHYDDTHRPPEQARVPSRAELVRRQLWRSLRPAEAFTEPGRAPLLVNHLSSVLRFYLGSQPLHITSRYGLSEALSRLRDMKQQGDVLLREKRGNELLVVSAHHGARSNVLPVFTGALHERRAGVELEGQIRIEPGILIVVCAFSILILLYLPLALVFRPTQTAGLGTCIFAIVAWLGLLEFGYSIGRHDASLIARSLERALSQ